MPSNLHLDHARGVVVVIASGTLSAEELAAVVPSARTMAAENDYGVLYDFSQAHPGNVSVGSLFWMPRTMPALKAPNASRIRVALLHPASEAEFARFWETTFMNAGLQARAFLDREAALAWAARR